MRGAAELCEKSRFLVGPFLVIAAILMDSSVAVAGAIVPDFALTDVNPNSSTYNQAVSARDYLGQVSAWYFGHAT
jgi:hypothetical protein